jgi:hypothetical protein
MEDLFKKYFKNPENQSGSKPETKESISVGRLNELSEKIIQIAPSDFYDIYSEQFLNNTGSLFEEFVQAENKLDSNSKTKLYKKIKEEAFRPKIKEISDLLAQELKELGFVTEKIIENKVSEAEKEIYESYLDLPAWQRLDKIGKLVSVLEKTGFDGKELKERISGINKIIEKQEYRTREGEMGKYDE